MSNDNIEEKNTVSDIVRSAIEKFGFTCLIILVSSISFLLIGCASKQTVVSDIEIQKVYVPVKCEVPEVHCDFKGEGYTPTQKLLECIVLQKRALEVCRAK